MSDTPANADPFNIEDRLARFRAENDRLREETLKLIAEQRKLIAESQKFAAEDAKLFREAIKLERDRSLALWAVATIAMGAGAALVAAGAALFKLLG